VIAQFPGSRSFVRPSGTEDIVRIYVETNTKEENDVVEGKVRKIIENDKTLNWEGLFKLLVKYLFYLNWSDLIYTL